MQTNREARDFINEARSKQQLSGTDSLGLLLLISIGISGVSLLSTIALYFAYSGLANKPMPALVQLANGKTIKVATMNDSDRTPSVIKDFVTLKMTQIMSWSGILPPETAADLNNPKPDIGVSIPAKSGNTLRVPTGAWRASFSLSADFQNPFLQELAKLSTTIQGGGNVQTRLEILNIADPILIQPGAWRVQMIANIVILRKGSSLPERVAFNKDIMIHTVPVPAILENGSEAEKTLSQLVAEGKSSGLEIYAITNPKTQEIAPANPAASIEPKKPVEPVVSK
jgi:hypothetical protein